MSVPCAVPFPAAVSAAVRSTRPVALAGRHRRSEVGARVLNAVARTGSLVTLSALLVLAGAVIGHVDDGPAAQPPTVTATFDGAGR